MIFLLFLLLLLMLCYYYLLFKGITITNAFKKIWHESNHKTNKISVNKRSEFYKRSMKSWIGKNSIEIYSTYYKVKSFDAEYLLEP